MNKIDTFLKHNGDKSVSSAQSTIGESASIIDSRLPVGLD